MTDGPIRLACCYCDRNDHDGISEIPADWHDVQFVEGSWYTHLGDCPDCWRTYAGTVDLHQRWFPGGAQGNLAQEFVDGDRYLFAVRVCRAEDRSKQWWEIYSVVARCDSETPVEFDDISGESWCAWSWTDVEWFCPVKDFHLPVPADIPTKQEPAPTETAREGAPEGG